MKSNDYIRFLTEEMMKYINLPTEEKKNGSKKRNLLINFIAINGLA